MEAFGKINLIHGDCMDYLRSLPDNAFSLACVDPPYGAGNQTDGGAAVPRRRQMGQIPQASEERVERGQTSTREWSRFDGSCFGRYRQKLPPLLPTQLPENKSCTGIDWDVAPEPEYFEQLFRVSKNQIIWGANYFPNMPPTRCFLVWRKLSISEKFSMAMAEYAWTSFNQNAKVFECAPQGKKNDPRFHPTAKPIELYAWIFNNFCKAGDTILDTHLGSGSSAIAAHQLGFDFTGIEIDDEYYEKAKERLLRYQAQLSLF
jgi:site-specific DNA-methyltransferase (adenine-specific)